MIEQFKNLSDTWQTTIISIVVVVGIAIIGGFIKLYLQKKDRAIKKNAEPDTDPAPPPPPPEGVIHNLPYGTIGKWLKGRYHQLKNLHKFLADAKPTAITQPASIHGLGGVGKSRLAVEFALQSLNDKTYNTALFVTADSVSSLNANLAALAAPHLLNLPEFKLPEQAQIVEAVINTLNRRRDWLLILDNVDDEAARQYLCRQILPRLTAGRVIITSRLAHWPPDIAGLPLDKLKIKDAAAYLRLAADAKKQIPSSEKLAQTLDGLPVALEQASAYIKHSRISFEQYLEEFKNSRTKTLERYEELVNYPSPTLFTWTATQDRLDPLAHAILRIASFLAPDPIPNNLFESNPDALAGVIELFQQEDFYPDITPLDSPPDSHAALIELADWSMINLSENSFLVHRLVQDAVRLTIPHDLRKSWTDLTLNLVNDHLPADPPPNDVRSWPLWTNLESHVA